MQKLMQQVWEMIKVRKWYDMEDSTSWSTEQGIVFIITREEDMVAFISRKSVTAICCSEVYTIYPRDQPVTSLGSKQDVIVIGNATHN